MSKYQVQQQQATNNNDDYNIKIVNQNSPNKAGDENRLLRFNSIMTQHKKATAALGKYSFRFLHKEYKEGLTSVSNRLLLLIIIELFLHVFSM